MGKSIDKKLVKFFIDDYKAGLSTVKIGKKYGVSYTTVYNYLKKHNVEIRPANERARKYDIVEDFFDDINTQEKAYFLGLLYADGCNSPECNSIRIFINENDKSILERLSKLIFPSGHPLSYRPARVNKFNGRSIKSKATYGLEISNKYISKQLIRLGLVKAKTHKVIFPDFLDDHLVSHFVRGYFDGDGSVSMGKSGNAIISILGTERFCNSLKYILNENLNINSTVYHAKKNSEIKQITWHGNCVCKKVLDWIYKDATLYLDRKYDKYIEILNTIPSLPICPVCDKEHHGKQPYCSTHYYEYVGRHKRRERYLLLGR